MAPSPASNVVSAYEPSEPTCPAAIWPVAPPLPPATGVKVTEPWVSGLPLYVTRPWTRPSGGLPGSVPQPPIPTTTLSATEHSNADRPGTTRLRTSRVEKVQGQGRH